MEYVKSNSSRFEQSRSHFTQFFKRLEYLREYMVNLENGTGFRQKGRELLLSDSYYSGCKEILERHCGGTGWYHVREFKFSILRKNHWLGYTYVSEPPSSTDSEDSEDAMIQNSIAVVVAPYDEEVAKCIGRERVQLWHY